MHWILIALAAPALWSASNHIDKYLVGRYFKSGPGAVIIVSAFIGAACLPFILLVEPHVFSINKTDALITIINGILLVIGTILYLHALETHEASEVVPLFQTTPLILFVLGYIFLGETLTIRQGIGGLLIIAGAILISLAMKGGSFKLRWNLLGLMTLSSLALAVSAILFKKVALEENFWISAFWGWSGSIVAGFFCFAFVPSYRRAFLGIFSGASRASATALVAVNEFLDIIATLFFRYAGVIAPLALVQVINGFQPIFVLILGIMLSVFFPSFGKEDMLKTHLARKTAAICMVVVGAILIGA